MENGCDDERRGGAVGVSKLPVPSDRARARKNDYSDDFRVQVICDGVMGVKVTTRIFRNKLEVGVIMS